MPTDSIVPGIDTAWLLGIFAVVIAIPAGRWMMRAIGKQIAFDILEYLTPSIRTVAREEIDAAVDAKLQPIYAQLQPNGGTSMHDRLSNVEQAIHALNLNTTRWDPPTGTPTEGS